MNKAQRRYLDLHCAGRQPWELDSFRLRAFQALKQVPDPIAEDTPQDGSDLGHRPSGIEGNLE